MIEILEGFISNLVALLIEDRRRKKEVREKHFNEIKNNCLVPLERELNRLLQYFEFREGLFPDFYSYDFCKQLKEEFHWWDRYSVEEVSQADRILFDDLPNHFENLYEKILEVDNLVKKDYPRFIELTCSLMKKIEEDKELEEWFNSHGLYNNDPQKIPTRRVFMQAIFMRALDYDKSEWPTYYKIIKEFSGTKVVEDVGLKYKEMNETKELKSLVKNAKGKINSCVKGIEEILHRNKLEGNCKYVET